MLTFNLGAWNRQLDSRFKNSELYSTKHEHICHRSKGSSPAMPSSSDVHEKTSLGTVIFPWTKSHVARITAMMKGNQAKSGIRPSSPD